MSQLCNLDGREQDDARTPSEADVDTPQLNQNRDESTLEATIAERR